jgi:hypothetical protein
VDLLDGDDAPDTWFSHDDANTSVMMSVRGVGDYVRALLPVRLTGGFTVTYGVWIAVSADDLKQAYDVWWDLSYGDLRLDGFLANGIEPWGLVGSHVSLTVADPEETPYCIESSNDGLSAVLTDEWPHELVLSTLP